MVKLNIVKLEASLNLVLSRKSWLSKQNANHLNLSRYQIKAFDIHHYSDLV